MRAGSILLHWFTQVLLVYAAFSSPTRLCCGRTSGLGEERELLHDGTAARNTSYTPSCGKQYHACSLSISYFRLPCKRKETASPKASPSSLTGWIDAFLFECDWRLANLCVRHAKTSGNYRLTRPSRYQHSARAPNLNSRDRQRVINCAERTSARSHSRDTKIVLCHSPKVADPFCFPSSAAR